MATITPTSPAIPTTITNLNPAPAPLGGGEYIVIVQNGVTYRVTAAQFAEIVAASNIEAGTGISVSTISNITTIGLQIPVSTANGGTGATSLLAAGIVTTSESNVVTNSMLAQMPADTIKGNNTGSTANAADLTQIQVRSLISLTPTKQIFTSGSGTYTTPANCLYIKVKLIGGGGGGGGSGNSAGGTGGNGGNTSFGISLLNGFGGAGGAGVLSAGGAGGTATLGSGPVGIALSGASGGGNSSNTSGFTIAGAAGAGSPFAGSTVSAAESNAGASAMANTGCGGQGGGQPALNSAFNGCGGGAGGYVDVTISSPAATYAYGVGAGGTAGTAGGSGFTGGVGGSGLIIVEEFYL